MIVITMILTKLITNPSKLGEQRDVNRLYSRIAPAKCQCIEGIDAEPASLFPQVPHFYVVTAHFVRRRQIPSLFEPQPQPPANQPGIADVRAAEDRLKVVEEQLIGQILDIELKVHRHALFLQQICAY